jgi:NTE family protein
MDGGVRSATNADLASGFKTALVVAPTFGQSNPIARHGDLLNELKALRKSGCNVELIVPDNASLKAFGAMLGHESRRAPAVNVGLVEGRNSKGSFCRKI